MYGYVIINANRRKEYLILTLPVAVLHSNQKIDHQLDNVITYVHFYAMDKI